MLTRTARKTVTFRGPFSLAGVGRPLPAGSYEVVTDQELIEGLSFPVFRRIATLMLVPTKTGGVEMVSIDPADLEAAQAEDLIMHEMQPVDRVLLAPNAT